MTLCYAFWISFSYASTIAVSPTTWPLAWIIFAITVIVNPLPILFPSSRWWFIRSTWKLLLFTRKRVEFADFWMGDQWCSLTFTLSNLYFVGCAYQANWDNVWNTCNLGWRWGLPFFLTSLPSIIRLIQCIKRWADSGLKIHLINGGKYTSSIVAYVAYYMWRHNGGQRDHYFVIWCMFATINSTYTSSWDLTMDWSLLRPHAKYKFLRTELVYTRYIPAYYFAIVSNVFIRFIWVWYIPKGGLSSTLRAFIFAMLEMVRRVQWNFLRLENEHLGNADQYRVTREIPLPYRLEDHDRDVDSDDDKDVRRPRRRSTWRRKKDDVQTPRMSIVEAGRRHSQVGRSE